MNKMMHIFGTIGIAVVLLMLGSWLVYGGEGSDDFDPSGDWTRLGYNEGFYEDGVPMYVHQASELKFNFEKCEGDDYSYIMRSEYGDSVWVREGDALTTCNLWGDHEQTIASLTIKDDVMYISCVSYDVAWVMACFRDGSSVKETPEYDPFPSFIKEGLILEGALVKLIIDGEDLTGDNYKLIVDRVESDLFFFRIVNEVTETREFVCVNYGNGLCMATAIVNSKEYMVDMLRPIDGMVYVASFDKYDDGERFWYAIYGDESKIEHIDADLEDTRFKGMQTTTLMDDREIVECGEQSDVDLYFLIQENGAVYISTMTEDYDWAQWGGLLYKTKGGYGMIVMSLVLHDGDLYRGMYFCSLSKDLSTLKVEGSAGYVSNSVAFVQELENKGVTPAYG